MNTPKISVIVAVYNTSKYLKKCLNSIINQTFKSIEIIIVNDGSTDNSLQLCENFKAKDPRITIIDKLNEGLELSRQSGLKVAKGEFVTFIDSDDWIDLSMLEKLYNEAITFKVDIVVANSYRVFDNWAIIKKKANQYGFIDQKMTSKEFMEVFYKGFFGINIFPVSIWGKLYKRSLITGIQIKKLGFNMGEDLNFNVQVFPKAKDIYFSNSYLYFYRYGGMTSKFNDKLMPATLKVFEIKEEMIQKYKCYSLQKFMYREYKNYLKSFIEMLIIYKASEKETNYTKISHLINDKRYVKIIEYFRANNSEEEFVKALVDLDVDKMYTISESKVKSEKKSRMLKKMISSILN